MTFFLLKQSSKMLNNHAIEIYKSIVKSNRFNLIK